MEETKNENNKNIDFNTKENIINYDKQDEYESSLNLENYSDEVTERKKDESIKNESNIKHKKNSNGELDLDFLDIPAFLRKQAD